jgi:cytochrome c556
MKRLLLGSLFVCLAVSAASATEDPIATRKKLMDANGAAAGAAVGMVKGEVPFDAKVAMAALQAFNSVSYAFGDYFPEGSDKGNTSASPKIWTDRAGFDKILSQFRADTEAAVKSKPQDLEALKAAMNTIGKDCGACHETYRLKKS